MFRPHLSFTHTLSLTLCLYLSIYLSICLSLSLPLYLYIFPYLSTLLIFSPNAPNAVVKMHTRKSELEQHLCNSILRLDTKDLPSFLGSRYPLIFCNVVFYNLGFLLEFNFTVPDFFFTEGSLLLIFFLIGQADLAECLERDGFKSVQEAVGADYR